MQTNKNKSKIISGLSWKFAERVVTVGIQFMIQIILARFLFPSDYGLIALITIFINISHIFVQSGFGSALIQKKEIDEVDYSSIFFLSLGIAGILYGVLFFTAPYIAVFFNTLELTTLLRVLALTLFFYAINNIQTSIISRKLDFKKIFFSNMGATLISGILGIGLAYLGFGVWALVCQQLINSISICLIMWFTIKWRPKFIFSLSRIKTLFSYSWKLLCSALLDKTYNELTSLIIGKKFSSANLGYYTRGKQFPEVMSSVLDGTIQAVMFPTYAKYQDDKVKVKNIMRRSIVTSTFLVFPVMIGLAAVAESVITILLTEKWLPCVSFLRIGCITFMLFPIHTANLQVIKGMGKSDIFLRLEIIKKTYGLIILAITVFCFNNVLLIAWGGVISSIVSSFVNASPNKKLLNYTYFEQIKDMLPSLLLSLFMGSVILIVDLFGLNIWITLLLQMLSGIVIYIGGAALFRFECFYYLFDTMKEFIRNRKR